MCRAHSYRSSKRSEGWHLTSVASALLLAMSALGPVSVQALDVQMRFARYGHEMFALNNKMVVIGGSKDPNPLKPIYPANIESDRNYLQTASFVSYDDWTSKDTTIVSGLSLNAFVAACARWDAEKVVCTGGLRRGQAIVPNDTLGVSSFSLGEFQTFAGTGVVNAGIIIGGNISIPARFDHAAVILGSTYYLFGGFVETLVGSAVKAVASGELYAVDLNSPPSRAKLLAASGTQTSPSPRARVCMVSLDSTSIFLFGGGTQTDSTPNLADSWIYNVGSGWAAVSEKNAIPSARVGPACTFLRGKVWMFGGGNTLDSRNDIWSFDPKTSTWTEEYDSKPNPDDGQPTNRYGAKIIGVGVHLIINGGSNNGGSPASDAGLYFFNTKTGKWATSAAQLQNITTDPTEPPDPPVLAKSGGLSGGIIGGIVAAVVLFAVGILLFFLRRGRNRRRAEDKQNDGQTLVTQSNNKPTMSTTLESGQQGRPQSSTTLGLAQRPEVSGTDFGNLHNEISVLSHVTSGSAVAAGAIGAAHAAHQGHHSQKVSGSPLSIEVMTVPPTRTEQSVVVNRFEHANLTDLPPSYDALASASSSSSVAHAASALISAGSSFSSPTGAQSVDSSLASSARVIPLPLNEKMGLRKTDSAKENEPKAAVASDDKSVLAGMPYVGHVLFRPGGCQEPVSGDEIMISPGDIVYVKGKYADGWAQGWNSTTNVSGFFPYSCLRSA
ncbi:hypothetical protein DFS34DRAFT_597948 [Phlyctochytrium arcticum]|nr:hypothetical protein DFS34DRAFT_597948 [Phlyctochytrium arcticum]